MPRHIASALWTFAAILLSSVTTSLAGNGVDERLAVDNGARGAATEPLDVVDDLAFLRRATVDLIGRIPTVPEAETYLAWPEAERRERLVDQLIAHERFADRWTIFYADMLRLRSNAESGATTTAYVHQSISNDKPYDEMVRELITANGKVGTVPELGFLLADGADPKALAGATSQVFLGLRVACAECHDHPFDVWTRKDFYGLAAFFGKTRRVQSQFTNTVFTQEQRQTTVLWPPEEPGMEDVDRKPMLPTFLYEIAEKDRPSKPVARLLALRDAERVAVAESSKGNPDEPSIDDLLADAEETVSRRRDGAGDEPLGVVAEAKRDAANLSVDGNRGGASELRTELADLITDPHNRYFSRSFANRAWAELIGRGIVDPVDDFSGDNPPSHPETLDYLADEFVANGFDLKHLVREIVLSDVYQRKHAVGLDDTIQAELEDSFHATPMRRMISEALYDSIVAAGHLFDVKHEAGKNLEVVWRQQRVAKEREDAGLPQRNLLAENDGGETPAMMQKPGEKPRRNAYNLEQAIELDFDRLLAKKEEPEGAAVDKMKVMSTEEIEAMRMEEQARNRRPDVEYYDRFVKATVDANPQFNSSLRMASPAAPEHFLRVFGQPARVDLGEVREHTPSMRQSLMLLNGQLTHQASRVGELEPIHDLVVGPNADLDAAVALAYREILTRTPSSEEIAEGRAIVADAADPLAGIADLRWVLLNCNEFRFIP